MFQLTKDNGVLADAIERDLGEQGSFLMLEGLEYWVCLNVVLVSLQSSFFFTFPWMSCPVWSLDVSENLSAGFLISLEQGDCLFLGSEVCFSQRRFTAWITLSPTPPPPSSSASHPVQIGGY